MRETGWAGYYVPRYVEGGYEAGNSNCKAGQELMKEVQSFQ